jgi:hypothetical protein
LLPQVAGRKHRPMFCCHRLQEGNIVRCFVATGCRKETSSDVLLPQVAGRKHQLIFCSKILMAWMIFHLENVQIYVIHAMSGTAQKSNWSPKIPFNKFYDRKLGE